VVYGIEEIIEFLSEIMTLEPGDIISLGSPPAGPPEGLRPGDVIEAEIEHMSVLTNYMVQPLHVKFQVRIFTTEILLL
jgi:2-keto-4-pentenoate hydratase/2-oxohepta-3-ene-1,7-dioic acid hydratase in catechol pathway